MKKVTMTAGWCFALFIGAQTVGAEEAYIDPEIEAQSEDLIEIIVDLKEEPLAAQESEASETNTVFNAAAAEQKLNSSSEAFLAFLDEEEILYDELEEFENILHGFAITVPGSAVEALAEFDELEGMYLNQIYEAAVDAETEEHADMFAAEVEAMAATGFTGKGIKVGVIDTGIDFHHPDLKHAYKGGSNFLRDGEDTPLEGYGTVTSTHGTNVSGVIAGKGKMRGVAPDAGLYVYRALNNRNQGTTRSILAAVDQAVEDDLDVLNLSIGSETNRSDTPMTKAMNHAVNAGIVVVIASGNNGEDGGGTVGDPGTAPLPITVGASFAGNGTDAVTQFSSRGPVHETLDIKPDLVAPGYFVYTTASLTASGVTGYHNAYGYYSGTSFSAPYVTGIAALMLEKNPALSPEEVKARLMNTSTEVPGAGVNEAGAGKVDAAAALSAPVQAYVKETHRYTEDGKAKELQHWNGSFNFRNIQAGGEFREDRVVQLRNTSNKAITYNVKSQSLNNSALRVDTPKTITLQAGEVKDITVTLRSSASVKAGYHEGYVLLTSSGNPDLRLPYGGMVEVASNPITSFQADKTLAGKNQKVNISWGIQSGYTASIAVINAETNKSIGQIPVQSGAASLSWDMKYKPAAGGDSTVVPDGNYKLQLNAKSGSRTFQQEVPIRVYSQAPEVSVDQTNVTRNEIRGTLDSYFSEQQQGNTALTATYELKQDDQTYDSGSLAIKENGAFTLLNKLKDGTSTFTVKAKDTLNNQQSVSFTITKSAQAYQRGDEGENVGELQQSLQALGFNPADDPKNVYGADTEKMVTAVQEYFGLEVNGAAGETFNQFLSSILEGTFATPADHPDIVPFKQRLTQLGFGSFPQNPSPRYGPVTEGVVSDFQQHHGLRVNGFGDPVTVAFMEEEWNRAHKDGDDNEQVRAFKQQLTALGFGSFPDRPSPRYGPVTEGVVREFQEQHGLVVSGTANTLTQQAVEQAMNQVWQDGDDHPQIVTLKQELTSLGYGTFPQNPSPRYGPVTSAVVSEFQRDQGIPVTGNTDAATQAKMTDLATVLYQSGDSSEEIRSIKQQLTQLGFGSFPTRPSVRYGPVTSGVTKDFQAYYDLEQTGNVNKRMVQLLNRETATVFQSGNNAEEIRTMKLQLTDLGFGTFPSNPSVRYGPVTSGVVSEFQQEQGLNVNGIVDSITYETIQALH